MMEALHLKVGNRKMSNIAQVSEAKLIEMVEGEERKGLYYSTVCTLITFLSLAAVLRKYVGLLYWEKNNPVHSLILHGFTPSKILRMCKRGVKAADIKHLSMPPRLKKRVLTIEADWDGSSDWIDDHASWALDYRIPEKKQTFANVIDLCSKRARKLNLANAT